LHGIEADPDAPEAPMLATMLLLFALDAGQTTAVPPPPQKAKLICREDEQMVGSHIHTGRRCKTAEEWQQEDAHRGHIPTDLRVMPTDGSGQQPPQRPQI